MRRIIRSIAIASVTCSFACSSPASDDPAVTSAAPIQGGAFSAGGLLSPGASALRDQLHHQMTCKLSDWIGFDTWTLHEANGEPLRVDVWMTDPDWSDASHPSAPPAVFVAGGAPITTPVQNMAWSSARHAFVGTWIGPTGVGKGSLSATASNSCGALSAGLPIDASIIMEPYWDVIVSPGPTSWLSPYAIIVPHIYPSTCDAWTGTLTVDPPPPGFSNPHSLGTKELEIDNITTRTTFSFHASCTDHPGLTKDWSFTKDPPPPINGGSTGGGGGSQPPSGATTSTYRATLGRETVYSGPIPYSLEFGQNIYDGHVVSLKNPNGYAIGFVKAGHTSAECFDGGAVAVPPNGTVSGGDIASIFGSSSPLLPQPIVACIANDAYAPTYVQVDVTYTHR